MIRWAIQFDLKVVEEYKHLLAMGKYTRLQAFCHWIGLPVPLFSAYLLIGLWVYFVGGQRLLLIEVAAIILTNIINLGMKAIFKRIRPPDAVFTSPLPYDKYAFPSGHAATTMSLAISLGLLIGGWVWLLLPWAFFMGVSRFFGELHYPMDILGGYVVGVLTGLMIRLGYFLIW